MIKACLKEIGLLKVESNGNKAHDEGLAIAITISKTKDHAAYKNQENEQSHVYVWLL